MKNHNVTTRRFVAGDAAPKCGKKINFFLKSSKYISREALHRLCIAQLLFAFGLRQE